MHQKTTVFIADGSSLGVSRIVNLLSYSPGVQILGFAYDVVTTLQSLRASQPDFLIMDLELRGGSGLTLLRSVRNEYPKVEIIVLTNASQDQYRKRCTDSGVRYFFDKASEFWKINDVLAPFPNPYQV